MENPLSTRLLAPIEAETSARIAWLIQLRWLAVVGALMAVTVSSLLLPDTLPMVQLVSIVASLGVCNVAYYVYSYALRAMTNPERQQKRSVQFTYLQIAVDLLCLTMLLHYAGGVENPFWILYILHIIVASLLLSRSAAFAFVVFATLLYSGLILLEYVGVIPHIHLEGVVGPDRYRRESYLVMTFLAFLSVLLFSALMATSIVARLRQRSRQLLELTKESQVRAAELAELNRQLEEMSESRERFIRLVTHELRSPAAAIQSYLRLILGGYIPPEKQPDILARVEKRADEQLKQISDLLIMSQAEEKHVKAQEVYLRDALNRAMDVLRGSAEEKQLSIQLDIDPQTMPIMGDKDQVYHIWLNLISNAIKYTPAGGSIEISLANRPNNVIGSVKDSGIGIAPKDQARIFDEYYRTEEAKSLEQHGTGLGLPIVKRIVEGYGGRIWVNSALGEGSKFTFVLPRTQESSRHASQAPEYADSQVGGENVGAETE